MLNIASAKMSSMLLWKHVELLQSEICFVPNVDKYSRFIFDAFIRFNNFFLSDMVKNRELRQKGAFLISLLILKSKNFCCIWNIKKDF